MISPRRALKALLVSTLPLAVAASALPPCPAGWDNKKWVDPTVNSPKYVVGRIIAKYPHTPNGLKAAIPEIEVAFPGSKHIHDNTNDKADIPCVGIIDLVVAADGPDVGTAWAWQVVKDRCGECSPQLCSPSGGGGDTGTGPGGSAGPEVKVPDFKGAVEHVTRVNPKDLELLQDKETCGSGALLEKIVLELRHKDEKFGFACFDGSDCTRTKPDSISYFAGSDKPYRGAKNVAVIKVIDGRCASGAKPAWSRVVTSSAWTDKGLSMTAQPIDHTMGAKKKCNWSSARACIDGMSWDVRTPNGDCQGEAPGEGFQKRNELGEDWARPLGPC